MSNHKVIKMKSQKKEFFINIPVFGLFFWIFLTLSVFISNLIADVICEPDKAIQEAFPDSDVQRKSVYLTAKAKQELEKKYQIVIPTRMNSFYIAKKKGKVIGFGIFDTHVVRSKEETIFVVFDAKGFVKNVRMISFFEPDDYLAQERWLRLFLGKSINDTITAGENIPVITGASLTTNKITDAIKRSLILYNYFYGEQT